MILGARKTWFEVEGATLIDIPTAKSFHDRGVTFIDTSGASFWNAGHISGAVHLSWVRAEDPRFSKTTLREVAAYNDEIVFYYSGPSGSGSWEAAKAITWGDQKVYFFHGGIQDWEEAGYLVETGQWKIRE